MLLSDISEQNPWWTRKEAINDHAKIREYLKGPVRWVPRLSWFIDFEKDALYSVRGPRQIGKTTLALILIKRLLESGRNSADICYFACDLLRTPEELYQMLDEYRRWQTTVSDGRKAIFLDEISAVADWQKALKRFVDQNGLEGYTFYLTSSHTLDIERSTERLPGRTGEKGGAPTHFILLPMKFSEYVENTRPELYENIRRIGLHKKEDRLAEFSRIAKGGRPKTLDLLLPLQRELELVLDEYLITGGVMSALNAFKERKEIPQSIYEIYIRQVLGDVARIGREERTAKQVIAALVKRAGSRASWRAIAQERGIPQPQTVQQYAHILQSLFLILTLHPADHEGPNEAKDKKIHFTNPFIFNAMRQWSSQSPQDPYRLSIAALTDEELKAHLIEDVVGNHLGRAAYQLNPTDVFDVSSKVFYWRTKKGEEVDFIIYLDDQMCGFEVKYQRTIGGGDYAALRKIGRGCLVTRSATEVKDHAVAIPACLFLLYV